MAVEISKRTRGSEIKMISMASETGIGNGIAVSHRYRDSIGGW
jgi:hypothetical protein